MARFKRAATSTRIFQAELLVQRFDHPTFHVDRCSALQKADGDDKAQLSPLPNHDAGHAGERAGDDADGRPRLEALLRSEFLSRLEQLANALEVPKKPKLVGNLERL